MREGSVREDHHGSWCHIASAANSGVESVDFAAVEGHSLLSIAGIDHAQGPDGETDPLGYRMSMWGRSWTMQRYREVAEYCYRLLGLLMDNTRRRWELKDQIREGDVRAFPLVLREHWSKVDKGHARNYLE